MFEILHTILINNLIYTESGDLTKLVNFQSRAPGPIPSFVDQSQSPSVSPVVALSITLYLFKNTAPVTLNATGLVEYIALFRHLYYWSSVG